MTTQDWRQMIRRLLVALTVILVGLAMLITGIVNKAAAAPAPNLTPEHQHAAMPVVTGIVNREPGRIYVVYPSNAMVSFRIGYNLARLDAYTKSTFVRVASCPAERKCFKFVSAPYIGGGDHGRQDVCWGGTSTCWEQHIIRLDPFVYKWTQGAKDFAVWHEAGHAFTFAHRPLWERPITMMYPHPFTYPDGYTRQPCHPYACSWLRYQIDFLRTR